MVRRVQTMTWVFDSICLEPKETYHLPKETCNLPQATFCLQLGGCLKFEHISVCGDESTDGGPAIRGTNLRCSMTVQECLEYALDCASRSVCCSLL